MCCGILADNDTHEELGRFKTRSGPKFIIDSNNVQDIEDMFAKADYIISYNGSKFDLPVLRKDEARCEDGLHHLEVRRG